MTPAGRRPGAPDTRATILDAARQEFEANGYNKVTIRAVARRADVDPALVYHYFGDKVGLFVAVQGLPSDPRLVKGDAAPGPRRFDGTRLVERFLAQWEVGDHPGQPFVAMAQAAAASPEAARAIREFAADRIGITPTPGEPESSWGRRHALVASQLLGVAWARWVLQIEPLASAPRQEVAAWVGPTLDAYSEEHAEEHADDTDQARPSPPRRH